MTFIIVLALVIAAVFLFKANDKDNAARKDAKPVKAIITKLRCEQRLKGDKSIVVVSYNGKSYSVFPTEKKCFQYQLNQEVEVFYSKKYDKLFLEL